MAFYLSPLVDVNEIDLSTTIPAVASSIACIVLRDTYKGPEMEQTLITNENELVSMFGQPRKRVYDHAGADSVVSTCYQDFFNAAGYLKYGNKLYCTRVMSPSATFAGVTLNSSNVWAGFTTAGALTLNTETMTGDITNPDEFHSEIDSSLGTDPLWIIANSRGYWGNSTKIALVDKTTQSQMLSGALSSYGIYNTVISIDSRLENDSDFLLIVQNKPQGSTTYQTVEVHNISLDEVAVDDQGQSKFAEAINDTSKYIRIAILDSQKNLATVPTDWVSETFVSLTGGADNGSDAVTDGAIIEGYELYQNAEEIDMNIFIDSNKSDTVKNNLIVICEARKDAMCVLDVPYAACVNNKGSETTDIVTWRKVTSNQNTSYAATYGNWFNVYNKYLGEYHWVPVSGYMAGLYARTDDMTDPWWAPAGLNRTVITGVRKLAWNPTQGNRDIMYLNGINPIVSFAGQGKVVWGQKTLLDKSSAFNRVNVRRLFMLLEKAISTASKYFLFEPSDRFTRAQLVGMIDPFLRDVQSRRGLYDFRIICDETNNTGERIDRNELWCDIYLKPTRAAEFIVLNFIATKTGVNFDEVIGVAG